MEGAGDFRSRWPRCLEKGGEEEEEEDRKRKLCLEALAKLAMKFGNCNRHWEEVPALFERREDLLAFCLCLMVRPALRKDASRCALSWPSNPTDAFFFCSTYNYTYIQV